MQKKPDIISLSGPSLPWPLWKLKTTFLYNVPHQHPIHLTVKKIKPRPNEGMKKKDQELSLMLISGYYCVEKI